MSLTPYVNFVFQLFYHYQSCLCLEENRTMYLWLILLVLFLAYRWLTKDHDYFKKIGIMYDKPSLLVGNTLKLVLQKESIIALNERQYRKFKKYQIYGFFNFLQKSFMLTDPDIIKRVTVKDFDHFLNHSPAFEMDDLFSRTLFVMKDKRWRDMRTTLSPIFTGSKMKMMFGLLSEHSKGFVKYMEERSAKGQNNDVNIPELFSRYTADGICTAALGFVGDSVKNEGSEVYKIVKQMDNDFNGTAGIFKFMLSALLPGIYKLLDLQVTSQNVYDFFRHTVIDVMNDREKKNISRPDVIQLLLQARKGQLTNDQLDESEYKNYSAHTEFDVSLKNEKVSSFEENDWIAQGYIFFGAGFDTSTTTLQTLFYELVQNPKIQDELIEEIDEVAVNGEVTYEALHKMKFLDMVLSEVLRKWPPAAQLDRCCTKDYRLELNDGQSLNISKGTVLFLPVYSIHHDPEYFPDPEKFDPYRFSEENQLNIRSGTYIPFGQGPRMCKLIN